jgi:hypothetical protein
MTDEEKLNFLLNELKVLAKENDDYGDVYDEMYTLKDIFEEGIAFGYTLCSRHLLNSIGEDYERTETN